MKIVHLLPEFNRGGTERSVINLSNEQIRNGHKVRIFSFSNLNLYPEETKHLDIVIINEPYAIYRLFGRINHNLDELESKLMQFNPDIIHSHSYWTDLLINAIKIVPAVSYFSHLHLYYDEHKSHKITNIKSLKRYIGRWLIYREYDKRKTEFIGISNDICLFYKKNFPKKFSKSIHFLPNFLALEPIDKFKELDKEKTIQLVSVGRLVKLKNHNVLIKLCYVLKKNNFKFHLSIAGDGPFKTQLETLIKQYELEKSISLLGNISKIEDIYSKSDIYLHPSHSESFGLVILEAMAFGLPCIVNESAVGAKNAITSEEGIFIDMNNINLTAQTIINLSSNTLRYEKMSKASLKRAKLFNPQDNWKKLEKIYISSMKNEFLKYDYEEK